ncbi:TnpA family transposase [Desmospora profundinema]|uniref:TnpA family transposase n=2 Tax=Desmospora profundinema TaxID=1571184 RepID=A0ABU1IIJ4_9BACL|nr:TnpA family transposase [Desmospora profundinema]
MATGNADVTYENMLYIKRKFVHPENLKAANIRVVNAILKERLADVWGEATTSCASDSKKFGSWDQNLMTEWHPRYRGPGVMIYWHVEKNSACIHSQLKTCTSSEVAAMIKGFLQHATEFESSWKKKYSDRGIRKILKKYSDRAHMAQSISPHKLRHFLLTWLKKKGIDDPYSGHASRNRLRYILNWPLPRLRVNMSTLSLSSLYKHETI